MLFVHVFSFILQQFLPDQSSITKLPILWHPFLSPMLLCVFPGVVHYFPRLLLDLSTSTPNFPIFSGCFVTISIYFIIFPFLRKCPYDFPAFSHFFVKLLPQVSYVSHLFPLLVPSFSHLSPCFLIVFLPAAGDPGDFDPGHPDGSHLRRLRRGLPGGASRQLRPDQSGRELRVPGAKHSVAGG